MLNVRLWIPLLGLSIGLATPTIGRGAVELDIAYTRDANYEQQLDLYLPDTTNFATILFIHGGELTSGDKRDEPYAQICKSFQELGIGIAAINYRLAPKSKWPAQPDDLVGALKWLKNNISFRGGNPDRIFLLGHSSGGLLAAIVAADKRYLSKQGLTQKDLAGVIAMGCRLNDVVSVGDVRPEAYESSWVPPDRISEYMESEPAFISLQQRKEVVPASYADENLPPFLLLIAEKERFFPPILRDGSEFVGRALVADADADIIILNDRSHMSAINNMTTPDDPGVQCVVSFVRSH